jgi:hypothetical protein
MREPNGNQEAFTRILRRRECISQYITPQTRTANYTINTMKRTTTAKGNTRSIWFTRKGFLSPFVNPGAEFQMVPFSI